MAVVFISPKQKQKVFFLAITLMFLVFLVIISLGVFLSEPKEDSSVLVFNKPKVNIDMSIFDSAQFGGLQNFSEMELLFSYTATARNRKQETGFVSAPSKDQAQAILVGRGLVISYLEEVEAGRENPFISYYQVVPAPFTMPLSTRTR